MQGTAVLPEEELPPDEELPEEELPEEELPDEELPDEELLDEDFAVMVTLAVPRHTFVPPPTLIA